MPGIRARLRFTLGKPPKWPTTEGDDVGISRLTPSFGSLDGGLCGSWAGGILGFLKMCHRALILLSVATLALAACAPRTGEVTQPTQPPQQYRLTATIQDLMDGIIDPSADVLWDSVAYIASSKGIEDRQPRTDAEWKAVRKSAITLIEAANLLSMPGRSVAPAQVSGGLTPAEIQQRIDSSHDAFVQFARNLQEAGLQALAAIDSRNAEGLMDAGGRIDAACEACHVTYWYPNERHPDQ